MSTPSQSGASSAGRKTDVTVTSAELYLLPVRTRVPLKFGSETLESVTCARVRVELRDRGGRGTFGWGETPLSVQWAWPARLSVRARHDAMVAFCTKLLESFVDCGLAGHPIEIGHGFMERCLPALRQDFNAGREADQQMPLLASLVCFSAFDIAVHDAYGRLHGVPTYSTYGPEWMSRDLAFFLEAAADSEIGFRGRYPRDFLAPAPATRLPAWHLVGGLDPLAADDVKEPPQDDLPVLLGEWIDRDGLFCLKIKLRGNDAAWDYDRLVRVGELALERGVRHLSADFNCTVTDPEYVIAILDRLAGEHPDIDCLLLYVEQPFPYELEEHPIDVHRIAERKPLFMDESAHSWQQVRMGRALGWSGVALKTCKSQTGALLALCWAKAHGMDLMVQDLTNPMLAQIPHVLLAAHAGTIMGVETNSMQFYPEASRAEAAIHPGVYTRRNGQLDLSSIRGPGLGYNGAEAARALPEPAARRGSSAQGA